MIRRFMDDKPFLMEAGEEDLSQYTATIEQFMPVFEPIISQVTHKCHCQSTTGSQVAQPDGLSGGNTNQYCAVAYDQNDCRMFYIMKCIFMKIVFIIKQHFKYLTSSYCDIKHIPKDLCRKRNYPLKPLTFACLFKISQKMSKITFKLLNSLNMAKIIFHVEVW